MHLVISKESQLEIGSTIFITFINPCALRHFAVDSENGFPMLAFPGLDSYFTFLLRSSSTLTRFSVISSRKDEW